MAVGRQARAHANVVGTAALTIGGGALLGVVMLGASHAFGSIGFALPLIAGVAVLLLRWPAFVLCGSVGLAVLFENTDFGLFPTTGRLYQDLLRGVTPIDLIFVLGLIGLGLQMLRDRRPLMLPPAPIALAMTLTALAIGSGAVVGHAAGVSSTELLRALHSTAYMVLIPFVIVNLDLDRRQLGQLLAIFGGIAIVKAVLGLVVVASGRGLLVGNSTLTYYEPTANWMTMVAALVVVALLLRRARPPLWMLAGTPLLFACLILSYRRSFWIGLGLALVVIVLLGLTPLARRVILPLIVLLGVSVWLLGAVGVQSDTPIGQRLSSLQSSRIDATPDDRYRLDERANVVAAIRANPVAGLGLAVPWQATARPLPVEVNPDHTYVHFAVLFWWLKMGVVGLFAYLATIAAGLLTSWRIFRNGRDDLVRAVGLASLCSFVGLIAIETTATFTGVDLRFTFILGGQLGLLGLLARTSLQPAGAIEPPAPPRDAFAQPLAPLPAPVRSA